MEQRLSIISNLVNHLDADIDPEYVEKPIPEDVYVHDTCADITKIRDDASWEPRIDLAEGLERVCAPHH